MNFRHGLVIGKFYPPHVGHDRLVRAAADRCDRVTVVVAGTAQETLSVRERVEWMRATHAGNPHVRIVGDLDDHPNDYADEHAWQVHTALFAAAVARAALEDGREPRVPSSTPCSRGSRTARSSRDASARPTSTSTGPGCSSRARRCAPTSSAAGTCSHPRCAPAWRFGSWSSAPSRPVRRRSPATWQPHCAPAAAPSTHTTSVPEYGRQYTIDKLEAARWQAKSAGADAPDMADLVWTPGDFVTIADRQRADEDAAAPAAPVLVCDTDAFATGVWMRRYLGAARNPWVDEVAAIADSRRHPVYLLTDHRGVEFEQDGIRDGEAIRTDMTGWFVDALERSGRPWALMSGTRDERLAAALAEVDGLLARGWEALR